MRPQPCRVGYGLLHPPSGNVTTLRPCPTDGGWARRHRTPSKGPAGPPAAASPGLGERASVKLSGHWLEATAARERRRRTRKTTAMATVEIVPEITTEASGKPANASPTTKASPQV